jgi:Mg2+/citrate symporter
MITATLAGVAVVMLIVALWQKKLWLYMTDALFWTILGIFDMNTYAYGEVEWYFGLACVFVGIILFMSPLWARAKREPAPLEPSRRQLYEERLDRELKSVKKKEEE